MACGIACGEAQSLPIPSSESSATFFEVLQKRASALPTKALGNEDLSRLLWWTARSYGQERDSSGIMRSHRAYPSAGGLYESEIAIISGGTVSVYDSVFHALRPVAVSATSNTAFQDELNSISVSNATTIIVAAHRCPLERAYENALSLLWRDAGCLLNVLHLTASALNMPSKHLGILGHGFVQSLPSSCDGHVGAGVFVVGHG